MRHARVGQATPFNGGSPVGETTQGRGEIPGLGYLAASARRRASSTNASPGDRGLIAIPAR